jgi:hypothetical protein
MITTSRHSVMEFLHTYTQSKIKHLSPPSRFHQVHRSWHMLSCLHLARHLSRLYSPPTVMPSITHAVSASGVHAAPVHPAFGFAQMPNSILSGQITHFTATHGYAPLLVWVPTQFGPLLTLAQPTTVPSLPLQYSLSQLRRGIRLHHRPLSLVQSDPIKGRRRHLQVHLDMKGGNAGLRTGKYRYLLFE